ncbi:MAG: uroporphyrinogen-III C-methyltransferase [Planctomycetes bacterium GWF2_41_51]|nr:MAG: uroporphyrinogen-III C-methyltransferase [Planctomycetes bacterium GWF2_41_51]HBG26828.1 uroporphyrinogen-III C-methyltransferase [Phycisphaerales bacterium]
MAERRGKVYMVGAGPGCMGLISAKALHILQHCDCVLYDRLIGKEILNLIGQNAELVYVGKEHKGDVRTQEEINKILIDKTSRHKVVVRLKGGDPMIFGRATEEIKSLIENKIKFEIVPGITAITSAAACAGIILTDRNTASSVTLVTGQTAEGRLTKIDFPSLVKLNGTIVFYMTVENMKLICQKLVKAGMKADTGAIIVANASLANQKIVIGTVSNIAQKCIIEKIQPPAVLIIGKKCTSLLSNQTLFGKKVLMTRDVLGNAEFACKLAARGAQAISCPMFEIEDLTGSKDFKHVVEKIKNYDWVFFTSPTGVKLFFKSLKKLKKDGRVFGCSKIGCIGSETATALNDYGIIPDFIPKNFTSVDMAKEFIKKYKPNGMKILLLRSALAEKLEIKGAVTETAAIYTAKKIESSFSKIDENVDWITFGSSFAVKCFFEKFRPEDIQNRKIASIGPVTTETLKKYSVKPAVEAKEHTIDGLIESMENSK